MPKSREEFDDLRPFELREPEEVLEPDYMYTVYEIARMLQGLDPDEELDIETEDILLTWTIPWMLDHCNKFLFGEPEGIDQPAYYGLR